MIKLLIKMKFKKSKKGTASENWSADSILFIGITGVVIGFTAIGVLLFFAKTSSSQTTVPDYLETQTFIKRFLKSPLCFIYSPEGIPANWIVDINKFNEDTLNSCYKTENKKQPAFRIILTSTELGISKVIVTKNWLSEQGFERRTQPYTIKIYSDEIFHDGEMTIEIQNSK